MSMSTIDFLNTALVEIASHSSEREVAAQNAERDVDDMKMAEYMMDHIGEEYDGKISGVIPSGMFVRLDNRIEGKIHISNIKGDYYIVDELSQSVYGKRSGKRYKLGDGVRIKVIDASKVEGTIDFELVNRKEVNNDKEEK